MPIRYYTRGAIRNASGQYDPWTTDRLFTVFNTFDQDNDKQLNYVEFRRLLYHAGELEQFDTVCGSEEEYKTTIQQQWSTGR